ncbi:GH116 family glycosyl hydrolase, partial [Caldivirga sp. UBA161]|uniref:GH116 family glycosyl hydrolase n=1 Tax=Caldivirga sp. UBA161 TaxID=1915569 RepID=UPI0025BFE0C1
MVKYTCGDALASGIPLGGIGTGGVELDNDGRLINARFANNWAYPIRVLRGFHIFIKPSNGPGFFMHCRVNVLGFEGRTTLIDLEGRWPFAWLRASKDGINVEVEAFTPIIPGNLKDSTLPVIGFTIRVKGSDALAVVSMPNVVGTNPIGRINRSISNGVLFTNTKAPDNDPAKGDMALMAKEPKFTITQHNINAKPEYVLKAKAWKGGFEDSEPWLTIDKGNIPSGEEPHEVSGLWDDPVGLIALNIPNGGEARLALSWFFNGKWHLYNYGHYYENFFKDSSEVAGYMLDEFDRLRASTLDWQSSLIDPTLPDWLRDAVINSTYILTTSTWLTRDGRFSILEGVENCPCHGTLSGACYETGSLPVVLMFPELEKSLIRQFTEVMRDDGYVPHSLGIYSLDHVEDGTTAPPKWKDLNSTYILLTYRYFRRSNDVGFIKEIYPKLVKAFEWVLGQDRDGDGVPELSGDGDTGFDAMSVKGFDSYTASLWIAALMAMGELARLMNDESTLRRVEATLIKARDAYNRRWLGDRFKAWDEPDMDKASSLAQAWGEWWSLMLGLGHITDEGKVRKAMETIIRVNGSSSPYTTPNLVDED